MHTITVLLTKYRDWTGRLISVLTRSYYTHASISIDEKEEIFYSFSYKGFVIEKPKKYFPASRCPGSVCMKIQVTDEDYEKIKCEIQYFLQQREQLSYSCIGVLLCLLHIPIKFHNKYFCSQFVAELLQETVTQEYPKPASLYLPEQLLDLVRGMALKKQIIYAEI